MKKIIALLLAVCLTLSAPLALAADNPFVSGVNYSAKFNDFGARPSMLNFGNCDLAPGESFYDATTQTITKSTAKNIERQLQSKDFYIYAKWQYAKSFEYYYIDAMLVMTDPTGNYYAKYGEWEQVDYQRNTICSWFFGVNSLLEECQDDHGGSLPRGQYTFSLFFNDMSFRVTKVQFT